MNLGYKKEWSIAEAMFTSGEIGLQQEHGLFILLDNGKEGTVYRPIFKNLLLCAHLGYVTCKKLHD